MLFIRMLCVRCWYAVSGVVFVSERLFRYSLRKTVRRDCQKRRIYIEALSISVLCAIVCILNGCVVFASVSLKYWEKDCKHKPERRLLVRWVAVLYFVVVRELHLCRWPFVSEWPALGQHM